MEGWKRDERDVGHGNDNVVDIVGAAVDSRIGIDLPVLMQRTAMEEDGEDDGGIGGCAEAGAELDNFLLRETETGQLDEVLTEYRWIDSRHPVVEEEHAGLERPDECHIAGPSSQQTLGADLKPQSLAHRQGCSLVVAEADVGPVLACWSVWSRW